MTPDHLLQDCAADQDQKSAVQPTEMTKDHGPENNNSACTYKCFDGTPSANCPTYQAGPENNRVAYSCITVEKDLHPHREPAAYAAATDVPV